MPLEHRGVGRRSASPVVVPEGPPSKLERRLQVDTSFECPATELTPVRPERLPSEAARRWSCSRASALTHQRGPRSGADPRVGEKRNRPRRGPVPSCPHLHGFDLRQLERLRTGRLLRLPKSGPFDELEVARIQRPVAPEVEGQRERPVLRHEGLRGDRSRGECVRAREPVDGAPVLSEVD